MLLLLLLCVWDFRKKRPFFDDDDYDLVGVYCLVHAIVNTSFLGVFFEVLKRSRKF